MALLHLHILPTAYFSKGCIPFRNLLTKPLKCIRSQANPNALELVTKRRSANYQPSVWGFDFLQSLKSDYTDEEAYKSKGKKLEEEVKHRLDDRAIGHVHRLELIDDIQRLGLSYLFEEEIKKALNTIACMKDIDYITSQESLHATALRFRLFRQHGYEISQGLFNHLKDEDGNFIASHLDDVKGVLSLYEASHLAVDGENFLAEAKGLTRTALEGNKGDIEPRLAKQVIHALELPLHWRMPWFEARWYIDVYKEKENSIPYLIELANLNFNIVQALHQKELVELSSWWEKLGLRVHLECARDCLVPSFIWALGLNPEPQFSNFRIDVTKVIMLISAVDDIYDIYGTLEELKLFTDAVDRWDIEAMELLPDYMKIFFLAVFNTVNEMGYFHLNQHQFQSIPFLKKQWADLCKACLVEANWYYSDHKTTLEEYLNNATTSIGGKALLIHGLFSMGQGFPKETLDCFSQYPNLFDWALLVLRLADDLGTSKDELQRGDVLKSIQSYMHETGASDDVAREHMWLIIDESWKKINKELMSSNYLRLLPQHFTRIAINLARTSLFVYQYGDGYSKADNETRNRTTLLLFEAIPLTDS